MSVSAPFNKFNIFIADAMNKKHNLGSDQLTFALTDVAPSVGNTVLSNITEISYTNISTRNITTSSSTQTSGVYKLILSNITFTASATVPQFRYLVVYNSTASGGPLIGWFDFGSEINMLVGDTVPFTFDGTNGLFSGGL